jgi:hypothetical protein
VTTYSATPQETDVVLRTSQAIATRDTERVKELARSYRADFAVVPWPARDAVYADDAFSVVPVDAAPRTAS